MNPNLLWKKSIATIKYEGIGPFVKKTYHYTKRKITSSNKNINHSHYKDILFINGCTLPHPTRYRVDHQIEQLHFNGYSCDSVYYENLSLELVKCYRGFIFFRCPITNTIEQFINKANYFNKKVFFDIDDLVIDYKYVSDIKYLKTMDKYQFEMYMDGVSRMQRTLSLCDYAITTTKRLADELKCFVDEVFINRNVASEKMVELSINALKQKESTITDTNRVILGYFSGSITHNDDFNLILPVIKKILSDRPNVYLKIVGILDVPEDLKMYSNRIIAEKFTDWTKLPQLISSVDINLAPLEETIFNEAKSENKWVEASLVKVATVASNLGAFQEMIRHGNTGLLCNTQEDWERALNQLLDDIELRKLIAENAYKEVIEKCVTAYTGYDLFDFIESRLNDNIAFVLPSTQISGGVNVVIKHCNVLRAYGLDVTVISMSDDSENFTNKDGEINVISYHKCSFHNYFNKCVATLWSTTSFLNIYPKIKEKYYLVQNFETNFYEFGNVMKVWSNLTYNSFSPINYITISKWCENWIRDKFKKNVKYARNGLDLSLFYPVSRNFNEKIRILVEGNSSDYYKNVDESFKITNQLDSDKYEIWYLSYSGKPKDWYKVDKFLHRVPYEQVADIYRSCHILLKSSILESFSYPPLEMMATGGIAVVAPNDGNIEYLEHRTNCLLYEQGNVNNAVEMIELISEDELLRESIIANGLKTASNRSWDQIYEEVCALYGVKYLQNGDCDE